MNPNQNAKHINAEKLNQQLGAMKRTNFEETSDPLEIKRSRLETTTESSALVPGNGGEYQRLTQLAHSLQNPSYASTQKEDDGKGDGLAGCNINLVASTSAATAATAEGSHRDCLASEKLKYSNLMTTEDSLSAIQKAGGVAPKAEPFDGIELLLLPNVPDPEGRHDMSSQPHLVAGGGDNISNELNKTEVAGTSAVTAGGANVVRQGGKYNANRLAVTTSKVVSRIKLDPNLKSSSLMITTKKMSPDVSQTTAKVSIGNTTISVPLLKPINSTQLMQSQKLNKESPKPIYPTMPVGRIFNVKPKVHPTIVSLSQLQIKPITTKLLNAKVVSKRVLPTSSTTLNTFVPQQGDFAAGKQATVQAKNCSQPTFKKKPVAKYDMTVGEEEAKLSTFPKVAKKPDKPPYAEGKEEAKETHEYIDTSEALSVTTTPSPVDAVNKLKSAPGNFEKLLDEKTIMSSMATADVTPKASFATTLHVKKHVVKMADAPSQEEPTTVSAAIHVMPPISKEERKREEFMNDLISNEEGTPKQETILNQSNLKSKEFVGPSADSSTDKVEKPCAALEKSKPVPNSQLPSAKSDDNQNALLKQLLQNSSNSQSSKLLKTHMKASPTPVTSSSSSIGNQLISTRKVINVRAPSLGLVSSLEAQLARPVIPPVSTNLITPQIQHDISSSSMQQNQAKSESQIAGVTTAEEENFQKQCTSKQIVTKETSFISNPNLIPDHLKPHPQKPNGEDTCQAANIEDVNPDTSEKPSEIKGGLNYKESPINKMNKPLSDSTVPMETIIYSGESQIKIHPPIQETPKHASEPNKSEVPFKITETKLSEANELDKTIFSAANNKGAVIERKGLLQTKQKSPAGAKINQEDAKPNQMGREQLLDGGGALAADAADNKQQTNNSNSKIDTIRKKRKRDTQKLRRPILKSNKDSTLANFTGAMSCASQKKKIKKMFKVDEDHDHYIDKIMMHMRNMESLEILEPLLDSNFTIGKFYERNNKFNSNVLSGDGDELFQEPASMNFGTAQFSTIKDFYDMDSTKVKRMGVNATAMHNEFYDQEFCSFLKRNEYNKMAKFIRQISAQQKNGNIPMKVNRNNFVSPDNGTFPGMFVKNQNRESSIGRMSPVVPYVNYCDNTITQPNAAIKENIHFIKDTVSHDKDRFETNETVIISLPLKVESRVFSVLKDLASILNIIPPHTFRVLKTGCHKSPKQSDLSNCYSKNSKSHEFITSVSLQKIFNGRKKMCRSCGKTLTDLGIRQFSSIPNTIHGKVYSMAIYLCSKLCLEEYKEQQNRGRLAAFPKRLPSVATFQNDDKKMSKDDNCSDERLFNSSDMDHNNVILRDEFANIDVITPKSFLENYETSESVREMYADKRKCSFCNQLGDGISNGPSRLLNYDHEKWVHLNCALWSNCVYETLSGSLMNFQNALDMSLKQHCSLCQDLGATVKCCKTRCGSVYHLPCAIRAVCVFYKNKSIVCPHHASKTEKENELTSLQVERRVYIERDERLQINSLLNNQDQVLRVGSLTFLNFGHLVPNQVEHFHTANNVYPVGYKSMRFYWSMKRPNKRCRYICSISEVGGRPEFSVKVQEPMESEVEIREASADEAWNKILKKISELRKKYKMIELYPEFLTGDDLFGLTEPNAIRIIENLPGIETLSNYRCKYSRQSFHDSPLPLNTTGAARTEPKHHQLINCRKPHTQRTCSVYNQRDVHASSSMIAGEVACPYSKQFVHSKSSQYKKMKQEWRNNVFLARSKIQGLGLYAARDIEKHTMIIEYIGEIIRTEVSEIREKQYEAKNRGIYMFRLDEERVVDATLSGGLARYINHSCNPNCVTETVDVDREHRIIIFAKRKISRGEELCYDYKFDIEDDANKLACMCTASNCRKWMN